MSPLPTANRELSHWGSLAPRPATCPVSYLRTSPCLYCLTQTAGPQDPTLLSFFLLHICISSLVDFLHLGP